MPRSHPSGKHSTYGISAPAPKISFCSMQCEHQKAPYIFAPVSARCLASAREYDVELCSNCGGAYSSLKPSEELASGLSVRTMLIVSAVTTYRAMAAGSALPLSFELRPEKPMPKSVKESVAEVKQYTHSTPPSFTAKT